MTADAAIRLEDSSLGGARRVSDPREDCRSGVSTQRDVYHLCLPLSLNHHRE